MLLNAHDLHTIAIAVAKGGKVWEDETLVDVKRKIKRHFLNLTNQQCCYCRKDFTDEFNMVIDIEHVLPKSKYADFMFEMLNLSVSCKRCNMRIKGERVDFIVNPVQVKMQPADPALYLLSHPNIDNYFQNMKYLVTIVDDKKSIKYLPVTDKGRYTYTFFELDQMEVETLNQAQGIDTVGTELSDNIPPDVIAEASNLIRQL